MSSRLVPTRPLSFTLKQQLQFHPRNRTVRRSVVFQNPAQTRSHFIAIMPSSTSSSLPASQSSGLSNSHPDNSDPERPGAVSTTAATSSGYTSTSPTMTNDSAADTGAATAAGDSHEEATVSQTRSSRSGDGMKRFELSPIPSKNPLGEEGRCIRTAAALVIGDEILNGKTMDKNSNYFAKFCFERGIDLKRIEVIPDDQDEITEASRRLVDKYDFVITTGGIGPTHDDITYASLAHAFGQSLTYHSDTLRRLDEMNRYRAWVSKQTYQQREATKRMALFPDQAEVLFVCGDIWVPVVRLEGKLCIFPGIPTLFNKMLDGLSSYLPLPPASERPLRVQIFTELPESMIAPYLTSLHARLKKQKADIQVGSYPVLGKGVFVSLIGRDRHVDVDTGVDANLDPNPNADADADAIPDTNTDADADTDANPGRIWLAQIASEVEKAIDGRIVSDEEVKRLKEGKVGEVRRRMEEGAPDASEEAEGERRKPKLDTPICAAQLQGPQAVSVQVQKKAQALRQIQEVGCGNAVGDILFSLVFLGLAQITTAARLFIRYRKKRLWWDDGWAFVTMLLTVLITVATFLTDRQECKSFFIYRTLTLICFNLGAWFARVSLMLSTARLIPAVFTLRRISEMAFVSFLLMCAGIFIAKVYFCGSDLSWYAMPSPVCPLNSNTDLAVADLILYILADVILMAIPLRLLYQISLPKEKRRMLRLMFSANTVTSIIATLRVVCLLDSSWSLVFLVLRAEVGTALIVANLAILTPYIYCLVNPEGDYDSKPDRYYRSFQSDRGVFIMRRVSELMPGAPCVPPVATGQSPTVVPLRSPNPSSGRGSGSTTRPGGPLSYHQSSFISSNSDCPTQTSNDQQMKPTST
ncbi:hypothetical protein D9757_001004 [Collybiopsis confluens]|uniref:MoaB/Mog domain-containing protein n=1 Tax=Collybiopsis confluens TaxID=2823264 RepID=A0A8H5I0C4_9AGAR|nr:hypothetical protein D9757_001004 [Collybiopsis confluens]